jgi:uncharacterized protein
MTSSPNSASSFTEIQYSFTRHVRDPENQPAPADIEDRRMGIYRELLYKNVEGFITNSFPVLRQITDDEAWHQMVRHYFKNHQSHTPLFPKMPQEFLQYLESERPENADDYPFLYELAHYEWVELATSIDSREISTEGIDREGDLLNGVPVLSPLAWPLAYQWPVHRISPEFLPREAPEQASYIIVYRNRSDEVGFLELNPVSARLIESIQNNPDKTGRELLEVIAAELNHPEPGVVIDGGLATLRQMLEKDIVLGIRSDL